MNLHKILFYAVVMIAISTATASVANAELIYGIQSSSPSATATVVGLTRFDSATPSAQTFIGPFTGVLGGQTIRSIDFRPATGALYAVGTVGTSGQLYTVNLSTAALTPIGAPFTLAAPPTSTVSGAAELVEIEFNPITGQILLLTGANLNAQANPVPNNYTIDPITGALTVNTNLNYVPGDPNGGNASITVTAAAYSNPSGGATTPFIFDYSSDTLARLGSVGGTPNAPSTGRLTSILKPAALFTNAAGQGLDFGQTGTLYMTRDGSPAGGSALYTVDPATGAQTLVGTYNLANGQAITDISVARIVTAAGVSVSGRVLTPYGRGLMRAAVLLTDSRGVSFVAETGRGGIYTFQDVEAGQTYTLSVRSRTYRYDPISIQVTDSLSDVDFYPSGGARKQ